LPTGIVAFDKYSPDADFFHPDTALSCMCGACVRVCVRLCAVVTCVFACVFARLLTAIDDERARRKGVFWAKLGLNDTDGDNYLGPGGEHLVSGCPDCGRMMLVADKAVDCQLLDDDDGKEEMQVETETAVKPKKRKQLRRFVGVDPPYDTIVKNPERWLKEKEVRRSMLTEKKILDSVTNIITHKVCERERDGGCVCGRGCWVPLCADFGT